MSSNGIFCAGTGRRESDDDSSSSSSSDSESDSESEPESEPETNIDLITPTNQFIVGKIYKSSISLDGTKGDDFFLTQFYGCKVIKTTQRFTTFQQVGRMNNSHSEFIPYSHPITRRLMTRDIIGGSVSDEYVYISKYHLDSYYCISAHEEYIELIPCPDSDSDCDSDSESDYDSEDNIVIHTYDTEEEKENESEEEEEDDDKEATELSDGIEYFRLLEEHNAIEIKLHILKKKLSKTQLNTEPFNIDDCF